jgi:hypothetical protein
VLSALFAAPLSLFQTRAALQLENLALRHQLGVLQALKKPELNHVTIWRWVQRYAPTRMKVAGAWTYLYRAVDSAGDTIDFILSQTGFESSAIRRSGPALPLPIITLFEQHY